uniref:RING-type domain-containing protein n=1 Tax=Glossina pallidipes TaxID=7398 RepID=A0A1B0A0R3_GLOPL
MNYSATGPRWRRRRNRFGEEAHRRQQQIAPYRANGASNIFPIIGRNVNRDVSDISPAIAHSATYNTNIAPALHKDTKNCLVKGGPWVARDSYLYLPCAMSRDYRIKPTIENNAVAEENSNRYQSVQRFSGSMRLASELPQVSERLSMNNVNSEDSLRFAPERSVLIRDVVSPASEPPRINARSYMNNANVEHSVNFALENNVGRDHSTPTVFDRVSGSPVISSAIIHASTENPNIADSINREIENSTFVTCDLSTLSRHRMYCNLNTDNRMNHMIENSTVTEQARNRNQLAPVFHSLVNTAPEDSQVNARSFVNNVHIEDSMNLSLERSESTAAALDLRGSALMEQLRPINLSYENIELTEENLNGDQPIPAVFDHVSSAPVISSVITHAPIENANISDSTNSGTQNGTFTNGSLATREYSSLLPDHVYYNINVKNSMHRTIERNVVTEGTRNRHESINQSVQLFSGLANAVSEIRQTNTRTLRNNINIEGSVNVTSGNSVLQDAALDLRGNTNTCYAMKLRYGNILLTSENGCRNYQASTNTALSVNRSLQNSIFTEDPRAISNISSASPNHFYYHMNIDNRINHESENTHTEEIGHRYQPATHVFENVNTINEGSPLVRARNHLHAYENDVSSRLPGILPTTVNSHRENMNVQGFINGIVENNGHMEDNLPSTSGTNYPYEILSNNNLSFSLPRANARLPSANMRTDGHMDDNDDQYEDMGLNITAFSSESGLSSISLISNPCSSSNRHSGRENVNLYNHVNWTRSRNGNTNNENGISEISSINLPSMGANSCMGNVDHNGNFDPQNGSYITYRQGHSAHRQHASRIFSHVNNFSETCPIRANAVNEDENIIHVIGDPESNVHAERARRQRQMSSSIINHERGASENFSFAPLQQGEISNANSRQNWAYENAQESLSSFERRNPTAASLPINAYPENFYASLENHRFRGVTQQVSCKRKRRINKRNSYTDCETDATCAICLDDFELHDNVRMLACGHEFHIHCLNPWLEMKPTCPLCRIYVKK